MTKRFRQPAKLLCIMAAGLWGAASHASGTASSDEAAAYPLNLERAIELALSQNRNLAISALGTRSSSLAVSDAESEFAVSAQPEVSFNTATGGDESSTVGLNISRKLAAGTELSSRLVHEELGDADGGRERLVVEVSQPLFRFAGRLVNEEPVIQAQSELVRARRQLAAQKQDLVVEVVREYENILRLRQQLESDRQSYERSRKLSRSTQAKEALGRASRVDTLRVRLQLGQAQSRLEDNRERIESTKRAFAELLGFDPETRFKLAPNAPLELDLPPFKEMLRVALDNRLDYAQALQDHRDARRGVRIARRSLGPDLRLVARYERFNDAAGGVQEDDGWFLGLTAGTDLNRIRERNRLGQARIEARSSDQFIQLVELSIARQLQQRLLAYRRATAEQAIQRRNLKHAEARLTLARRLYEIGRSDNFTVTDAEDAFIQAESRRLAGESDVSITAYELLRSMGTLSDVPEDLKPRRF